MVVFQHYVDEFKNQLFVWFCLYLLLRQHHQSWCDYWDLHFWAQIADCRLQIADCPRAQRDFPVQNEIYQTLFWVQKIVLRMADNIVAILYYPNGIYLCAASR